VLAFTAYNRDAALAGAMLGVWGGGAMAGGVLAFRLVDRWDPRAAGGARVRAAGGAAVGAGRLAASGGDDRGADAVGPGQRDRVPPMTGVIAARIPAALRAGTMTVAYSVVLASGFRRRAAARWRRGGAGVRGRGGRPDGRGRPGRASR